MRKQIIGLFCCVLSLGLTAQVPTIESKQAEQPIVLENLAVEVELFGNIGVTTFTMSFYNPNNRVLEGELNFPLLNNQHVIGYGLDVNGNMRDGVAVEKEQAQKVFEEIERRQVDPGIIEKTEGNNYRTRIYPINPKSSRTVKIVYQENLDNNAKGNFIYQLPLVSAKRLKQFSIKVTSFNQKKPLVLENPGNQDLQFSQWQNAYVTQFESEDFQLNRNFKIQIPHKKQTQISYYQEGDETYYLASLYPKAIEKRKRKLPKKVTLFWDSSYSMRQANHQKFYDFVQAIFQANPSIEIDLIGFAFNQKNLGTFRTANNLIKQLKQIQYDGASRINQLNFFKANGSEIWLISDGLNNLSEQEIKFKQKVLYTFQISASSNYRFLRTLAQQHQGDYVDLNQLSRAEAVDLWQNQSLVLVGEMGKSKEFVYQSTKVAKNQAFLIAGKIKSSQLKNKNILFGYPKIKSPKEIIPLEFCTKDCAQNQWVKTIWANLMIDSYLDHPKKNKKKIVEIAKAHSIVTDFTSLIVLEDIQDYVDNKIVPPKALQKEYFALLDNQTKEKQKTEKEWLDIVWAEYEKRIQWWETDFKVPDLKLRKPKKVDVIARISEPEELAVEDAELEEVSAVAANAVSEVAESSLEQSKFAGVDVENTKSKSAKVLLNDQALPDYLTEFEKNPSFTVYDSLRHQFNNKPVFFLEVANVYHQKNQKEKAYKTLSNLAEIQLENYILMRILAHQYQSWQQYNLAEILFKKVLEIRPEEPQSYRDLALLYAENNQEQKAVELLWEVVQKQWDGRFSGINDLALFELNNIANKNQQKVDLSFMPKKFYKPLPVDVRVVLNWSFPNTDLDLWVTNPFGEKAYYQNKLAQDGGRISNDFTQGYGPEEYIIKKGKNGKYKINTKFFASRTQKLYGMTVLQAEIYTNFGKENQKKQSIGLQIKEEKDVVKIGEFLFNE